MQNNILSVIIPIFNAKASLIRCIDSVVLQDLTPEQGKSSIADSLELILVDDGSTDGSAELCENIKRQYEDDSCHIVVLHQQHAGVWAARKAGFEASTGELVTFIDADDFLGKNTYSKQMEFFQCADDVDVVEFPVAKFYNEFLKKEVIEHAVDFYSSFENYLYDTKTKGHTFIFNKIFKRQMLISDSGDANLQSAMTWLSKARRIVTNDGGMYFYTYSPNGLPYEKNMQQIEHKFSTKELIMRKLKKICKL